MFALKNKFEVIVFILLTIFLITATHIYSFLFTPPDEKASVKTIFIEQGASFRLIAKELEKVGIITRADRFSMLAKLKGAVKKAEAGEYEFTTSMLPTAVLDKLVKGQVKEHSITIPEGYNIREIAETLDAQGFVKKEEFIEATVDKEVIASLNIDGTSLEGYLFPDTYKLTKGMTALDIIKKMTARFNEVYVEVRSQKSGVRRNMSTKEIVTLASIIEKETGKPEEMPLISAVFHNRLKRGMKLDSDPTVIYGIKDFNGNITKKDLETVTPYNTYKTKGLPPGPIANTGRASLEAALNPADEDYLFFVSKNNGSHHFSKDIKEHNKAVDTYQAPKTKRAVLRNG
ncbi:MAG: endolytic transglycosylase MltG [Deltaproteobacteria bacterium]|nr:endolytic transglycosylase MltG [Deltaproteobacteria bacterium]